MKSIALILFLLVLVSFLVLLIVKKCYNWLTKDYRQVIDEK